MFQQSHPFNSNSCTHYLHRQIRQIKIHHNIYNAEGRPFFPPTPAITCAQTTLASIGIQIDNSYYFLTKKPFAYLPVKSTSIREAVHVSRMLFTSCSTMQTSNLPMQSTSPFQTCSQKIAYCLLPKKSLLLANNLPHTVLSLCLLW
ncbi:hypothetical protein CDAR_518531 [Caerostris darwini]|uniref:Uncharacterized protein n=1 Tax=Caerostris darwini TaxID=1538125 RepID=A0AAV4UWV9_9ARAC|nr:hypothetical protein CDAR_518531 [Caerostris darwini]